MVYLNQTVKSRKDIVLKIMHQHTHQTITWGSHYGLIVNVLNYDITLSEFKLQSPYGIYFQTNILKKGMKPLISTTILPQR